MKEISRVYRWIVVLLISFFINNGLLLAQEKDESTQASEVAKKLANPNATVGFFSINFDYNNYRGSLPSADTQNSLKLGFQPSFPYPIGKRTNLFVRPLIPVIFFQPTYTNSSGFDNQGINLGDISMDISVAHTFENKMMILGGAFISMPTATHEQLGSGRWNIGPEGLVGKSTKWGFIGILINHAWSVSKNDQGTRSITGGQYFYTVNLKKAWQIQAQPTYSFNWAAPKGSKATFPIGTGVSKTTIAGKTPLKFSLQYWYYVASNDNFGVEHQLRFIITPVIKLPW